MIIVLKLITGEELIGVMNCTEEELETIEHYEVFDPMYIVSGASSAEGSSGAMKLRDALLLSQNEGLIFNPSDVITMYKPSDSFENYYSKAVVYSKSYTKTAISSQINLAADDLMQMMREEDEAADKLTNLLLRVTGSTLQ